MVALEITKVGEGFAVGHALGVALLVSRSDMRRRAIDTARAALTELPPVRGYVQWFVLVPGTMTEASGADRGGWVMLAEQAKLLARAGALVVPGEGFAAAALRAAISGVMLLARGRTPTRVVATVGEAASFLRAQGALEGSAAGLEEAVRGLVDALSAARSA
jgi:hypothetical protein